MTNQVIPDEAVDAAWATVWDVPGRPSSDISREEMRAALEAATPLLVAGHLETLAADVKARGDIGKDGGLEAWDYLTWKAEQIRPTA